MSFSLVETSGLTKRYAAITALEDCQISVNAGEVFGLLGPNGAGKSTLIRLLMGFLRPTQGSARIKGFDCQRESLQVRSQVAYLPGDVRLFRWMRGHAVLRFFSAMHPGGDQSRAVRLAERLELDLSRRVASCSSGMRQKLALAATLAIDAPLLILDEPTTHLDPTAARKLALVDEAQRAGRTIMFSSHVMSEVEAVCDRVAILRSGKLVHTERLDQLRRRHLIRARLSGPLGPVPPQLDGQVQVSASPEGELSLEAPGDLKALFGWLATLPISEVQIEPVGLKTVYDQFHGAQET